MSKRLRRGAIFWLATRLGLPALILTCVSVVACHAAGRALLVGVGEYPRPIEALRGVKDDVRIVKEALVKQGVFAEDEILTLVDEAATKARIMDAFREWVVNGTRPGDTVLFYFSGHGTQVWDENGDEADGKDEALLCWDSKLLKPKVRRFFRGQDGYCYEKGGTENLLIDDEIHEFLQKLQGRDVIFISDSCHSGTVSKNLDPFFVQYKTIDQPQGYKSVFDARAGDQVSEQESGDKIGLIDKSVVAGVNFAAIAACDDTEKAKIREFSTPPTGFHSVLTWYLYQGLMGNADLNRDGVVTLGELAAYLSKASSPAEFDQTPQCMLNPQSMASRVLVGKTARTSMLASAGWIERPSHLTCHLHAPGIAVPEAERLKDRLSMLLPFMRWTEPHERLACRIAVEKKGTTYGARLSDSTGAYWESHRAASPDALADLLAGNLKAYFLQLNFECIRNRHPATRFEIIPTLTTDTHRAAGQIVEGDEVSFQAKTEVPGYLHVLNVDSSGVIHPLWPMTGERHRRLNPGDKVMLGSDGSLKCRAPFGKEIFLSVMCSTQPRSWAAFWEKDSIGDPGSASFREQKEFLDALWKELTPDSRQDDSRAALMWALQSFKR
ncbi:MAG: caspase family protein [Thermodesulfobacteriota bacterium]